VIEVAKVLIVYYSETGNTEKMASVIGEGVSGSGVKVDVKNIGIVKATDLLEYDGIIIGSPTYYGHMAASIKKLLDESVDFHGDLEGKLGGAFSSSGNVGGGNETTIRGIHEALLIHGMIIQGDSAGDHYGPVSIGSPDKRAVGECRRFGSRFGELLKRLF
jgi:NAD(P)H dehydrogenase (quinone)